MQVAPATTEEEDVANDNHHRAAYFMMMSRRCERLWQHKHTSQRGAYSVERLVAFDEFCREVSFFRVLLTCCLLPLPTLAIAVTIELIPLQDPSNGWKDNYGGWVREIATTFCVAAGFIIQTSGLLSSVTLKPIQIVCLALSTSISTVLVQMALAAVWTYPVPFGFILIGPAFWIFLAAFSFIITRHSFQCPELLTELRPQVYVICIQMLFVVIYCAFSAEYNQLPASKQPFLVLGLPVLKFIMLHVVARIARHIEEYMPGIAVLSGQVFNALYVAKCMQSSGSRLTNVVLIALNIIQDLWTFYSMAKAADKLLWMIDLKNTSLVEAVLDACQHPNVLSTITEESGIRLRSSLCLRLSVSSTHFVNQLEKHRKGPALLSLSILHQVSRKDVALIPHASSRKVDDQPQPEQGNMMHTSNARRTWKNPMVTPAQKQEFVHQALHLFFQCEYHALVGYVECVVPVIYAIYVSILCQFPSAEYQPETKHLTTTRLDVMIDYVLVYSCWEMLSLIALHIAVRWRFGCSLLYLLAFVLHSRFTEFQGRLLAIFAYVISITLVHNGSAILSGC